ncbi:MAG: dsDNA-binding SOS-regulon protein [Cocleimonas sp.]|jgi:dsDNA-binding SOS-regulon protein
MTKLTGVTALSRRKDKDLSHTNKAEEKITTVSTRRNVTTTTSPVPIRLTENDKAELSIWLAELQSMTSKKITTAKLMRGLIHMREKINDKKLIEAIKDAS